MKTEEELIWEKYSHAEYILYNTCVDYDDGMEVLDIVKQDDYEFSEDTYFHDPSQKIPPTYFYKMTKEVPSDDMFYGYNEDHDIIFKYNPADDIHYFYHRNN